MQNRIFVLCFTLLQLRCTNSLVRMQQQFWYQKFDLKAHTYSKLDSSFYTGYVIHYYSTLSYNYVTFGYIQIE